MPASHTLDRRVQIERQVSTRAPGTGADVKTWAILATLWASVDEFTNTGATEEYMREGVEVHGAISRIRIRYRSDIDTTMRVNLGNGVLRQIVGMAMMGRREGLELSCKEWSHE